MTDFPNPAVTPQFIHPFTLYGPGTAIRLQAASANPVAFTWTANLAVYVPIAIPWAYPVKRVWWVNGSTIGNNVDFGIYSSGGKRIYSTGSTAQVGTSAPQFVTPSPDFILPAGNYYFAYVTSGTTSTAFAVALATAGQMACCGILSQATALPLPATATFATGGVLAGVPLCGITRTASGF